MKEAEANALNYQTKVNELSYKINELERNLTVKTWNIDRKCWHIVQRQAKIVLHERVVFGTRSSVVRECTELSESIVGAHWMQ